MQTFDGINDNFSFDLFQKLLDFAEKVFYVLFVLIHLDTYIYYFDIHRYVAIRLVEELKFDSVAFSFVAGTH